MKKTLFSILFICSFSLWSYAGLIVEIDPNISAKKIKGLSINGEHLIVQLKSGSKTIQLPKNALAAIALWVKQNATGPFVFSIDSAIVPGSGTYIAAPLPHVLGSAMLDYDVYAHQLALGSVPEYDSLAHPLIAKAGDDSLMPHLQYSKLMDKQNQSIEALRYRHLLFYNTSRPSSVGELTIKAIGSSNDFPVQIAIESYLTLRSSKWHLSINASSPNEKEIFGLPYAPLKEDMETRWNTYRASFQPMDELSSIVETYALLSAVLNQKPALWNSFIKTLFNNNNNLGLATIPTSSDPYISSWRNSWQPYSWADQCSDLVGDQVETGDEAEVAMSLLWRKSGYYIDNIEVNQNWWDDLEILAEQDNTIKAKLLLLKIKKATDNEIKYTYIKAFFRLTRQDKTLFRLRVKGVHLCKDLVFHDYAIDTTLHPLYKKERKALFQTYIKEVNSFVRKTKTKGDNLQEWERLSRYVYSTDLLSLAQDGYDYSYEKTSYNTDFLEALALVHYYRGKAVQKGRQLAFRHAHFRFLKYMAKKIDDKKIQEKIHEHRKVLAQMMGITKWDEDVDLFGAYSQNTLDFDDDDTDKTWRKQVSSIEGTLVSLSALFKEQKRTTLQKKYFKKGMPCAIKDAKNNSIVLLIDSRLFLPAFNKNRLASLPLKVYGITMDHGKSIQPMRIEYLVEGSWKVLDVPYIGFSLVSN